ncbi:MAG: hypothetical protein NZ851_02725 [Aquificaceae bacterium]|nr:hypothetical protein [Aquificaceae bacterium]
MLVAVLHDEDRALYDAWFTYGSIHETKAYRVREIERMWFRRLWGGTEVHGDRICGGVYGVRDRRRNSSGKW